MVVRILVFNRSLEHGSCRADTAVAAHRYEAC